MRKVSFKISLIAFILTAMEFNVSSYMVYACVIIFVLLYGKKISFNHQPNIVYAFLLIIFTTIFRFFQFTPYMFNETILLTLGIIPFLFNCDIKHININALNILCCFIMFMSTINNLSQLNISIISILQSNIGTEGNIMPFIMPLFAIDSLLQKKYNLFVLNVIMSIIGGKRIAFLGLIVAIGIYYCFRFKGNVEISKSVKFIIIGICLFYIFFIYCFCSGYFDDIIYEYTGLTSNAISLGRFDIYNQLFERKDINYIYGLGIGSITNMLEGNSNNRFHNDLLKILGENGIFIFLFFLAILLYKVKYKLLPYYIYLLIIYLTDNTFIYVPVTFMFCFMCVRNNESVYKIKPSYEKNTNIPLLSS